MFKKPKLLFFAFLLIITAGSSASADTLPDEERVFGIESEAYPEESDYIVSNQEFSLTESLFNNVSRKTRTVSISGKEVVFEAGHANRLYDNYHDNDDIGKMNIYAETVIIRSPLRLPQTEITVYARELRFEDKEEKAFVSTVPRSLTTRPNQFQKGSDGLKAGNITLYVESVDLGNSEKRNEERFTLTELMEVIKIIGVLAAVDIPNIQKCRFFLAGGSGQPAGLGQDGTKGTSMAFKTVSSYTGVVYEVYKNQVGCDAGRYFGCGVCGWHPTSYYGTKTWPGNGGNAIPGGKPGNGGNGGIFYSSAVIDSSYIYQIGGQSGEKASDTKGGAAGEPVNAVWIENHTNDCKGNHSYGGVSRHTSAPGSDAPAPSADIPKGTDGTASVSLSSTAWLHPAVLKQVIAYTDDLYLNGHLDEVEAILNDYLGLLDNYKASNEWDALSEERKLDFSQMYAEMQILLNRIGNHLDYFGNPAGWVPMLSFEVNKEAFESEIDQAVRVLYLSYWMSNKASDIQQKIDALKSAKDKTEKEIGDLEIRYDNAIGLIPDLEVKAAEISDRTASLQNQLQEMESRLISQAENADKVPVWKKVAKIAGAVCTVCPVGQPVVGAVGVGLTVVSNINPDKPWDTVKALPSIVKTYNSSELKKKAEDWRTARKECKAAWDAIKNADDKMQARKTYLEKLGTLGKFFEPMGKELSGLKDALQETEVPKNEINAKLEQLKAESPEFTGLIKEVAELTGQKEIFAQELAATMQNISDFSNTITGNLLALDGFNYAITEGSAVLDPRALMYLEAMEKRAKERLLKYHYYVAKAYEYRMLSAYHGELDINRLFEKFKNIAETGAGTELNQTDFEALKSLYKGQLSAITAGILDAYNSNPPELSAPVRFTLSADNLKKLNKGEAVIINPAEEGLFQLSEENIRIVGFTVDEIEMADSSNGAREHGYMDVYMEHSGVSKLTSAGETYLFRHYSNSTKNPVAWGIRYDSYGGIVQAIEPSAAGNSLLASLTSSADDLLIYSRPAAWADIIVTKTVNTSADNDMMIQKLVLKLTYDFMRKPGNMSILEVTVSDDSIKPQFTVSPEDRNGRKDGITGYFRRVYSKGQTVRVEAPSMYDEWKFEKWTDRNGAVLNTAPVLQLSLGDSQTVKAHYMLPNLTMVLTMTPSSPANLAVCFPDESECSKDGCGANGFTLGSDGTQTAVFPVTAGDYRVVLRGTGNGVCQMTATLKFGDGVISSETLETEISKYEIVKSDINVGYQKTVSEYPQVQENRYDFNADGCIDIADIMKVASKWNAAAKYDAFYDFDQNSFIGIGDIMTVASRFTGDCN